MSDNSANLNMMAKAARKAARSLLRDFGELENLQVSVKGVSDFVSAADIRAEEILRETLELARPNYGWLGEETEEKHGADPTRRWIVDPLDGTSNFLHALPHFAISIALEHRGEIVAALIYDPVKDEMFTAEKGGGAWLNGNRIRVSARSEFSEALFATGVPFGEREGLSETIQEIEYLMPKSAGIRRWGSAALDLAYVAAGRYDGFWERGLQAWDLAAGILIAREAGAMVSDLQGGTDIIESGSVIAANGALFERLSQALTAARLFVH